MLPRTSSLIIGHHSHFNWLIALMVVLLLLLLFYRRWCWCCFFSYQKSKINLKDASKRSDGSMLTSPTPRGSGAVKPSIIFAVTLEIARYWVREREIGGMRIGGGNFDCAFNMIYYINSSSHISHSLSLFPKLWIFERYAFELLTFFAIV